MDQWNIGGGRGCNWNGTTLLRKSSGHWNIPLTSLFDHLYGKISFKKLELQVVLIVEEDEVVVAWALVMQGVVLSISL